MNPHAVVVIRMILRAGLRLLGIAFCVLAVVMVVWASIAMQTQQRLVNAGLAPVPNGLLAYLPAVLYGVLGMVAFAIDRHLLYWLVPWAPDGCPGCGYDMRGLVGKRCPECGWRPASADERSGNA